MKSPPVPASIALALFLVAQPGCGVAQRAGKGAAEGALGAVARKMGDHEGIKQMTEGVKRRVVGGAVDELSLPEQLKRLQQIAAAMAEGTVSGVSRASMMAALERAGERGRQEVPGATLVEAITEQAARAFSRQLVTELGPTGAGPLTTSLSAMTEQTTASIARGARGELAPLFPECRSADASQCLDRAIERVSRVSSAGLAAGLRDSLGVWPLVPAFVAGALVTLALAWARGIHRARPVRRAARFHRHRPAGRSD